MAYDTFANKPKLNLFMTAVFENYAFQISTFVPLVQRRLTPKRSH